MSNGYVGIEYFDNNLGIAHLSFDSNKVFASYGTPEFAFCNKDSIEDVANLVSSCTEIYSKFVKHSQEFSSFIKNLSCVVTSDKFTLTSSWEFCISTDSADLDKVMDFMKLNGAKESEIGDYANTLKDVGLGFNVGNLSVYIDLEEVLNIYVNISMK